MRGRCQQSLPCRESLNKKEQFSWFKPLPALSRQLGAGFAKGPTRLAPGSGPCRSVRTTCTVSEAAARSAGPGHRQRMQGSQTPHWTPGPGAAQR